MKILFRWRQCDAARSDRKGRLDERTRQRIRKAGREVTKKHAVALQLLGKYDQGI